MQLHFDNLVMGSMFRHWHEKNDQGGDGKTTSKDHDGKCLKLEIHLLLPCRIRIGIAHSFRFSKNEHGWHKEDEKDANGCSHKVKYDAEIREN